jgi:hypothetical protein
MVLPAVCVLRDDCKNKNNGGKPYRKPHDPSDNHARNCISNLTQRIIRTVTDDPCAKIRILLIQSRILFGEALIHKGSSTTLEINGLVHRHPRAETY